MFSCEFCEISKNTFSYRTPLVAASAFKVIQVRHTLKVDLDNSFLSRKAFKFLAGYFEKFVLYKAQKNQLESESHLLTTCKPSLKKIVELHFQKFYLTRSQS